MLKEEEKDMIKETTKLAENYIKENITNKGHKIRIISRAYKDDLENNVNEFLLQLYKNKNIEIVNIKLVSEWVCFIHYKFIN